MKIVILLFASFFSFGLAVQETVRVDAPAATLATSGSTDRISTEDVSKPTEPVFSVLLDTVEITTTAPASVALHQ